MTDDKRALYFAMLTAMNAEARRDPLYDPPAPSVGRDAGPDLPLGRQSSGGPHSAPPPPAAPQDGCGVCRADSTSAFWLEATRRFMATCRTASSDLRPLSFEIRSEW